MTGEYRLVPVEILDRFPEINPSNYDHDDACALNSWGVEVALSSVSIPTAGNVVIAQEPKNSGAPVTLTYRNYRGEVADRTITPKHIWFGSTEWHPEPQWLLTAFDHEKQADRDFALQDFGAAIPAAPQPEPPSDLVERAREFWGRERHPWPGTFRVLAAFAVEYAAEQTREWSARALIAEVRAEAAERELEEKTTAYHGAVESRQHWRERAEVAERKTLPALVKSARAEEREACAKVAEAEDEFGWSIYNTPADIAAAIRARKGGENDTGA